MTKKRISIIVVAVFLCGLLAGFYVTYSVPSSTLYLTSGVYSGASEFTIFVESNVYYAKNAYGQLIAESSNCSAVVTQSIANLPTTGGLIQFMSGEYDLSNITIDKNGTTLRGIAGSPDSALGLTGSVLRLNQAVDMFFVDAWYVIFEELTLYGNRTNYTSGSGIRLAYDAAHFTVRDCQIMSFPHNGIVFDLNGGRVGQIQMIYNNEITDIGTYAQDWAALNVSGLADAYIAFNEISGLGHGIYGGSVGGSRIIGNKIYPVKYGLYFDGVQRMLITSNIIEPAVSNLTRGMYLVNYAGVAWGTRNIIANNEVHDCHEYGIILWGQFEYNIIEGNAIYDVATYSGIEEYDQGNNNVIQGNTLQNCPALSWVGSNTTVRHNVGFLTENSGTASVADGGSIAHGLGPKTPNSVILSGTDSDYVFSCQSKDATNIFVDIKYWNGTAWIDATGSHTVYWYAVYK